MMRKVSLLTAASVVAVIFFVWTILPPRPERVPVTADSGLQRRTVAGAYHVHSTRSDGAGNKATIAAAASRAGLHFVILTDHGDGTRLADAPEYLHGVLCIDAVEISTDGGHYVAIGMDQAPYPLGGAPSAVVEDVRRFGGFGVAAHPDSPRAELAWSDWAVPIDAIEWLSADTEWRDESRGALARALVGYAIRPGAALASMLDRPHTTLARWDSLSATRPVVGLAAHDAHGGIGRGVEEGGARRSALRGIPSYEGSFRTFSNRVILDAPLTGDAAADATRVLDAIKHGRVFTVVDAVATPGFLDTSGSDGVSTGPMGSVFRTTGGSGSIAAAVSLPAGARLFQSNSGREAEIPLTTSGGQSVALQGIRGAVRLEVRVPGAPGTPPVPWIVGNPIYFLPPLTEPVSPVFHPAGTEAPLNAAWHAEKDPSSTATVGASTGRVTFDYTLGAGTRASQFAALVSDLPAAGEPFAAIRVRASSSRPVRVSIQLRYPVEGRPRWGTSVYVDSTPRDLVVAVDRMHPLDRQTGKAPDSPGPTGLLLVADLTNARPGDSNTIQVEEVALIR
jgi:hypothetical protein